MPLTLAPAQPIPSVPLSRATEKVNFYFHINGLVLDCFVFCLLACFFLFLKRCVDYAGLKLIETHLSKPFILLFLFASLKVDVSHYCEMS